MKFVSAGHCNKPGPTYDPGAVAGTRTEAAEAVKMRDAVVSKLKLLGYTDVVQDLDTESLGQYLARIKTGNGSVVCEFHFNAGPPAATGVEVIVEEEADRLDIACAREAANLIATVTGLRLRGDKGVIKESDSARKRLGLMREEGIIILVELAFISNADDMFKYDRGFDAIATGMAQIIAKYDAIIG